MDNSMNLAYFLRNSRSMYYITTDREGKFTYANDLFIKIFIPLPENIREEYFYTTIYPDDIAAFHDAQAECLAAPGKTSCVDLRKVREDGSLFWIRWEFCVLTAQGEALGLQGLGNDITERKRAESEKIAAQGNLQLLLNNTEEAFIMVGRDLRILSFNRAAEENMHLYFGARLKKELPILDFAPPGRVSNLEKLYANVLSGREHHSETHISYNGSALIFTNYFKPVYNSDNNIEGVIITSRDVTQNKFSEEKLVRERYLLRILIDHLPDYIYVKDTSFRHIINNRAHLELIGAKTEEETLGKTALDYFDKETAERYLEMDQIILASGEGMNNKEELLVSKTGEKKWLLTTKVPLKEANEKVIGLVGISRDITESKKIEESLRRSIERLNIVSKATNDAIWDWDLVSGDVLWNNAVKNLFGFDSRTISEDEFWWTNHIHPSDKERVLEKIYRHIRERIESWEDEYQFVCADGTIKSILDRGFILFDDDHKPYRMIGAMMDITHRKKLEDELAEQKIARQRQITEAAIMAQERERAEIGRELHDNINQILTTTKLYIDMAINEEEIRDELMVKSHSNISTAIEEIRILSKSLVPPSLGDIGIKEAILEMINNLNRSQRIKIKLRTVGFGKTVIPDNIKLMVFRIIQEQLNNIIKHSKASQADIKLAVSKENLNITVMDNGVGFDTRKKTKGIGLTNIISRAEVHNGNIEIVSSPGNGCTLRISIPL